MPIASNSRRQFLASAALATSACCLTAIASQPAAKRRFALAIHGGAGKSPDKMTADETRAVERSLGQALNIGVKVLAGDGAGLDAVEQVINDAHDRGGGRWTIHSRVSRILDVVSDEEKLVVTQHDGFAISVTAHKVRRVSHESMAASLQNRRQGDRLVVDINAASFKSQPLARKSDETFGSRLQSFGPGCGRQPDPTVVVAATC